MVTEFVVIGVLLIILLALVLMLSGKGKREQDLPDSIPFAESDSKVGNFYGSKCPLCGEFLPRGERVHSHLFSGKPDGMMHILGCPHCYKDHPRGSGHVSNIRVCPYCHDSLGPEDYVIARVFEKPGKTQVHVLGCTICRDKR